MVSVLRDKPTVFDAVIEHSLSFEHLRESLFGSWRRARGLLGDERIVGPKATPKISGREQDFPDQGGNSLFVGFNSLLGRQKIPCSDA